MTLIRLYLFFAVGSVVLVIGIAGFLGVVGAIISVLLSGLGEVIPWLGYTEDISSIF